MHILPLRRSHLEPILTLQLEFEDYLQSISSGKRENFDIEKKRKLLLENAFGKKKNFSGYVARIENEIVGYVFYHSWFDPDEMQGKVIYVIDLFVSEKARGQWAGRALIQKLQSHPDSLGLYFWVWTKNTPAIEFYKKLGARLCDDVPFMKLMK